MTDKPAQKTRSEDDYPDTDDNSRIVKEHRALKHQSSVKATDYPASERAAQSLVRAKKKRD